MSTGTGEERSMEEEPEPIELAAIARGLEDEGRYLAARLFRAAARGEEARRTRERPRSNEDIADAIDEIVHSRASGHLPEAFGTYRRDGPEGSGVVLVLSAAVRVLNSRAPSVANATTCRRCLCARRRRPSAAK